MSGTSCCRLRRVIGPDAVDGITVAPMLDGGTPRAASLQVLAKDHWQVRLYVLGQLQYRCWNNYSAEQLQMQDGR